MSLRGRYWDAWVWWRFWRCRHGIHAGSCTTIDVSMRPVRCCSWCEKPLDARQGGAA